MEGLIKDTHKLQTYLDNALIPWVQAVKDHPALGGWDIINEIEGFITPGGSSSDPCVNPTSGGWAGHLYTARELQRFINWQADAIYRADPQALVTAGSASQGTQTDMFGKKNIYKDECLIKAGGKQRGVLNFYSTHTYDWEGKFAPEATFKHDAADYGLDKPLVIAEFSQVSGAGLTSAQEFTWAYEHGYAGAWSWQMLSPGGNGADTPAVQATGMESIRHRNDQSKGGRVALTLH
ncbi:hypothetical protein BaRGS_00037282 [Batillaria attramentaria]|uniref:Uncharacterized protein n=1 Tax=Batillaria attramentaria TaxID=370345 RepID=A0ABD0J9H2_9CAEN|nr:hypothetical protein BaRGS_005444 [Batillaria attramentaria]